MPPTEALGSRTWVIPEGYIPSGSAGPEPQMTGPETACIHNTGAQDASVGITLYFPDRDPVGPYRVTVPARRTLHLRFNELDDPEPVPRDSSYASVLQAPSPSACSTAVWTPARRRTRCLTTIAYPA